MAMNIQKLNAHPFMENRKFDKLNLNLISKMLLKWRGTPWVGGGHYVIFPFKVELLYFLFHLLLKIVVEQVCS